MRAFGAVLRSKGKQIDATNKSANENLSGGAPGGLPQRDRWVSSSVPGTHAI